VLQDRTGLAPANLDIILTELQRAGLLTVVKHPATGPAPLIPRDESSESMGSNTTASGTSSGGVGVTGSNKSSGAGPGAVVLLNTGFSSRHRRITLLPKKMEEDREKAVSEDVMKVRERKGKGRRRGGGRRGHVM
jgi:hypothetical protein